MLQCELGVWAPNGEYIELPLEDWQVEAMVAILGLKLSVNERESTFDRTAYNFSMSTPGVVEWRLNALKKFEHESKLKSGYYEIMGEEPER